LEGIWKDLSVERELCNLDDKELAFVIVLMEAAYYHGRNDENKEKRG
jgi:hypothetical protein